MPKAPQNTTPQRGPPAAAPRLREDLAAWYRANQRRLPWRDSPSLYKTVVSEFMLQQTQVATVLPYFARWLEKFPDFRELAAASEAQVLKMWEGLGYYRRARLLHALAKELVKSQKPPSTVDGWLELPGIGPYTAAAISSIAFGVPSAVVDGNVVRVLARLLGESRRFRDGSEAAKHFTPAAQMLLNANNPGDHNQAMMELGATVCIRRKPLCHACPFFKHCLAVARGEAEKLPRFAGKHLTQAKVKRLWVERNGALLLHRMPAGSRRLAKVCELPNATALHNAVIERKPFTVKRRTITTQTFVESIHRATFPPGAMDPAETNPGEFLWATPKRLERLTLSGPHRRWINALRQSGLK